MDHVRDREKAGQWEKTEEHKKIGHCFLFCFYTLDRSVETWSRRKKESIKHEKKAINFNFEEDFFEALVRNCSEVGFFG